MPDEPLRFVFLNGHPYMPGAADGAIPNDARVVKIMVESSDETPIGTYGKVLSSLAAPPELPLDFFYFIEWDDKPGVPVGVADWKLARA